MVQCDVRYTKVATDIQDETETERVNEDSDEEQVTVYLKLPGNRLQGKADQRLTCFRVSVSLILLGIVLVFALLQWYKWWPDTEEFHNARSNLTNISKEHDGHHHHTTTNEDDEHEDTEDPHHHEHNTLYHHAVVLTASADCSRIGKALLLEGGNVVDAAIASLLCLGVVHPHTAGVGGIFSAIFYNNTSGSLKTIRQSTAPQMSSTTFGVPSILQGIQELHSQWGRSEWSRLFKEAITLAQEGFLIDNVLGRALGNYKEGLLVSKLCDLFCDATGHMKSVGAIVKNQNLSELLQTVSLNENNFLDTLAVKLSKDLSLSERPAFLAAIHHSRGEINESVITEGKKYSVLSAGLPFASQMLSDILQQFRQQSLSFQNGADFNRTSAAYSALLNSTLAERYPGLIDKFVPNTQNSHISALDKYGNFVIMSASLNSTWGSGRFLPSSGIFLNSFTANLSNLPYFNFPLVLRLFEDDASHNDDTENNKEENEVEVVAIAGGLSALFNAALLLHKRIDLGTPPEEAISSPLLHLKLGISSTFCLSGNLNDSDLYMLLPDSGNELQQVNQCSDRSQTMLLRLHADHVSAYGAPAASVHINGF